MEKVPKLKMTREELQETISLLREDEIQLDAVLQSTGEKLRQVRLAIEMRQDELNTLEN